MHYMSNLYVSNEWNIFFTSNTLWLFFFYYILISVYFFIHWCFSVSCDEIRRRTALVGQKAVLLCDVQSRESLSSVIWMKNENEILRLNVRNQFSSQVDRYDADMDGSDVKLTISNVTFSDSGTYSCTCYASIGTTEDNTFQLQVQG